MVSPQKENGYTPIANEIMEALAGIRIAGEARQCLDVILRKTYGFNKKEDKISLSQFVLLTKMPKPEICRALRKLAIMNIIIGKKANDISNSYRLNKDYSSWKPLAKKPTIGKDAKGRWQKSQSSLAIKRHTKETITKDNITKDNIQPTADETKSIIQIMDIFKTINPTLNYGHKTNRQSCLDLIKQFGLEAVKKYASYAVKIQGQDYAPTITTPYQLKEKLAQLKIFYDKSNKSKTIRV